MKCSGKQHPYPTEIERLNKDTKEKEIKNVIDQVKSNEENLQALDKKILSESETVIEILQSSITNITQVLQEDYNEWKREMKSLNNNLTKIQQQITDEVNQKLRMGLVVYSMTYVKGMVYLEIWLQYWLISIFILNHKLSLLSNDIKKVQEQQLLRDEIQDRAAHIILTNLTDSINEIGANTLSNITDLSSKVDKNSLGRLSRQKSMNFV